MLDHAKPSTGAAINPAAKIGRGFFIDHADGNVIGEPSEIRDGVTLPNNVILGATGVAGNLPTVRHPRIGNNVQIAANVRILGPISIGDDAHIDAGAQVVSDVPAGGRVSVVTALQVHRGASAQGPAAELMAMIDNRMSPPTNALASTWSTSF